MSAADEFTDAFDALLTEMGPADALAIITGTFVSLALAVVKNAGHSIDRDLKIDGGEERDITIHAPKATHPKEQAHDLSLDLDHYAGRQVLVSLADKIKVALAQQPAATSETVNVIGMPEFDGLLDHIYEHGTAAEGVIEKANAFARAVIARYAPQQPAAVDEAMVFRLAVWMAKHDGCEDPHRLIYEGSPPVPWGEVWNRYEYDARAALTAALASQQQEPPHDRQD